MQREQSVLKQMEEAHAKLELQLREYAKLQLSNNGPNTMEELQWKLATAQATKEIVGQKLREAEAEAKSTVGKQIDVDLTNREMLQAESMHKLLVQQRAELSTEASAPSRVMSMEDSKVGVILPEQPIKSLPLMEMLIALAASLCFPFGLAVGWEWMVKRVNCIDDIRQRVGMPILGEIAVLPSYTHGRRVSKRANLGRQLFQESVDGLRTTLVLADSMRTVQVLAVASTVSSEGKTSVATHLAMSLARTSGKPILLIDGDLRAPDIHHMFDLELSPGLAEVLTGEATLEQATAATGFAQLDILPAGTLATSPHRLLHNGEFRTLLESLREKYAYILIDTPPVLAASESLVLANHADATVLCVLRDRTRMSNVQEARMRLADAGARTIGVVMSGLPIRHYTSRYGSYSYGNPID